MLSRSRIILTALSTLAVVSCKTVTTDRVTFPNTPVAYQLVSEMVDEETLDHTVKFRNVGTQIVSFDYTIADEPGVPHTNAEGPNSGLVENLYPGAEISVKNPMKHEKGIFVVLGKVSYGKRTSDELTRQYKPSSIVAQGGTVGTPSAAVLPLLEPVPAP
jgi:hypothetical protein